MNETGIIWTEVTWNPATGCKLLSPGCAFCYAKTIAEDRRGAAFPNGFELTLRPHKLRDPIKLKEPSLIFVNSMSDLFWEEIDDEYRDRVLDVIEQTPRHQYQVLTKRPEVMLRYSRRRRLPGNFWAGVTIESQPYAHRADTLRQVAAEIRFVSAEPLLGPLSFDLSGLHWLIAGGESGRHLIERKFREPRALVDYAGPGLWPVRAERVPWIRRLRDDCIAAGVAFHFKQWGGLTSKSGGRTLDGRTWEQWPRLPEGKSASTNPHLARSVVK